MRLVAGALTMAVTDRDGTAAEPIEEGRSVSCLWCILQRPSPMSILCCVPPGTGRAQFVRLAGCGIDRMTSFPQDRERLDVKGDGT